MDKEKFYQEVYDIVKEIPYGRVMTYGQIANLIGMPKHSRMVGKSLHKVSDELNLPCHRVVNSKGRLVPFWQEQVYLLKKEGVEFTKKGYVDMKKYLWQLESINFSDD